MAMIAVMGASGRTGGAVAHALLAAGVGVRAMGRSPGRLAALAQAGAEIWIGDLDDARYLEAAFRGVDAVYALLPTDRRAPDCHARQQQHGAAIAAALRASGVRRVVALSSLGAELDAGTGVIRGLHEQEQRLLALDGVDVRLLRAASFYENFLEQRALVVEQGIVADSVAADLPLPMVATRDVATIAAEALAAPGRTAGGVRELLGPRDLSRREAVGVIGRRIGRPALRYVQLGYDEMAASLLAAGLSSSFATLYVEMTQAINDRRIRPRGGRSAANATPWRFEDFIAETAPMFEAASP
jgi:uncharacterized protein YbjT (DUF2867 family)